MTRVATALAAVMSVVFALMAEANTVERAWRDRHGGDHQDSERDTQGRVSRVRTARALEGSDGAARAPASGRRSPLAQARASGGTPDGGTTRASASIRVQPDGSKPRARRVSTGMGLIRVTSSGERPGAPIRYEVPSGVMIDDAIERLAFIAQATRQPVGANLNGTELVVQPGEGVDVARARYRALAD